jgi:hypothetical protein
MNLSSLPKVEDGLILSKYIRRSFVSLPRVAEGLILSEYIRVSFVSLPVADGLILPEWMKHEYCLRSPEWRMDCIIR